MPTSFPTIRSGSQAIYPVVRTCAITTKVIRYLNGTEQRWQTQNPLQSFVLQLNQLSSEDRAVVDGFFNSTRGTFASDWQFSLNTSAYTSCAFDSDVLVWSQDFDYPTLYNTTLQFHQTVTGGTIAAAGSMTYPALSGGNVAQYPYSPGQRWQNRTLATPGGRQRSDALFHNGYSGFPDRQLNTWEIGYPTITDEELATLEAFFVYQAGMYGQFNFTDPDSAIVYPKVRFDMPALQIHYEQFGLNNTSVRLAEFF